MKKWHGKAYEKFKVINVANIFYRESYHLYLIFQLKNCSTVLTPSFPFSKVILCKEHCNLLSKDSRKPLRNDSDSSVLCKPAGNDTLSTCN